MSLDVYLEQGGGGGLPRWAIFVREDGRTKEISLEEWNQRFPGRQPVLVPVGGEDSTEVFSANITHNLREMAIKAGIFAYLWKPEDAGIESAYQLIDPLTEGLERLRSDPEKFRKYNPENGWGNYENLVQFVEEYLTACREYPEARVRVWR